MQAPGHLPQAEDHPVAGDVVTLETEKGGAVIADIAPRRNVFVRPPMANLDVLFLVASTTQPTPSTLVLDKLSAIAVDKGVQPVIVCTKGDLAEAEFLRSAYEKSTCPSSASTTPPARVWTTSGTGSMAVSAPSAATPAWANPPAERLLPDVERQTAAISQKLGRGRHTTREVTIFEAFGGRIADTPASPASRPAGRASSRRRLWNTPSRSSGLTSRVPVHRLLPPLREGLRRPRRLAEGKLSQTRYDSYCAMYDEVKDVKEWQRPKGM